MSKSKKQIKKVDESFIKKGAKRIKKEDIEKVGYSDVIVHRFRL